MAGFEVFAGCGRGRLGGDRSRMDSEAGFEVVGALFVDAAGDAGDVGDVGDVDAGAVWPETRLRHPW